MFPRLFIVISLLIGSINVFAATFGSFTGHVTSLELKRDHLVKLELIPDRESEGKLLLRAVLTLQFGGFESGEYVTYHFEDVQYELLTGKVTFNQANQEIYVVNATLTNGNFAGDLQSSTGPIGPMVLTSQPSAQNGNPLVEPLGGEYRGSCNGTSSNLQLFTYRSTEDTNKLGNHFGAYEVKGQLGKHDPNLCENLPSSFCTYTKFSSAAYNFFTGQLLLNGYPSNLTCKVKGSSIDCGTCKFKRVSTEMAAVQKERKNHLSTELQSISWDTTITDSIKGQYKGFIYHENLNRFQKLEFDISTFQQNSKLMIGAVAKVKFGDQANEIIAYKFDPTAYPNPLQTTQFILEKPEEDMDALIHVESLKDGVIKGVWYSTIFGRVGAFEARQETTPTKLPAGKRTVESLTADYEESGANGDLLVNILVTLGTSPVGSDNPYYPLNLNGWVWRKSGITKKQAFLKGSYDFYTGKIALIYEDERVVTGAIDNKFKFRRLGGGFGTKMQKYDLLQFNKK